MKNWEELTTEQQQKAHNQFTNELLEAVVSGAIVFNDKANEDTLQKKIDAAIVRANGMHTPWFAGEYIMEAVGDRLKDMAEGTAMESLYAEEGDPVVICGIC